MRKIILIISVILFNAVDFSYAQPGSLDATFGTSGGTITTPFGRGYEKAESVAIQSDGKIVVAGTSGNKVPNVGRSVLARYNSSNGSLDNTFGSGGKVTIGCQDEYFYYGHSVAIKSDGKIVVAGERRDTTNGGYSSFTISQYFSNGSLDNCWGTWEGHGHSVAIQSDGKIVAAGTSGANITLLRCHLNFGLDIPFGLGGIVTTAIGTGSSEGNSVSIQNDGKIIVAGGNGDFVLVRYKSNGTLDNTFGLGGIVTTDFGSSYDDGRSVVICNDGKIIVAGVSGNNSISGFAVARYNSNGSLDNSFGSGGKVITFFGGNAARGNSVAIQNDGKIVVAGEKDTTAGRSAFALVRYNNDGSLDNTFGSGGKLTTWDGIDDGGLSVAIQSDQKIVVAGYSDHTESMDFVIARYNNNCAPPPSPSAINTSICSNNTANLSATGSGTLGWYSEAVGGTYLGGGANYTTPILTTNNIYYVQDSTCAKSTIRKALYVDVHPLPSVTVNASASFVCQGTSVTLTGVGANTYTWSRGVSNGVGFTPTATDTYTLTGTDGNNCSNTATKTIIVNPLPTITAIASATNVCAGNSVTLTGGGATSYSWSGGVSDGLGFIPVNTSSYIVTGTDGNNCSNTATKTINVNPLPDVTANANATNVCAGSIVTLTGGGATSYSWSGGVSDGLGFIPINTTTYTVTGTDGNNCSNTATKTINVNPLPDVNVNLNGLTISANQTGAIYQWLDFNNANSIITGAINSTYIATMNGDYAVIVSMNGCSDTSKHVIINISGVNEMVGNNKQLMVFPNPGNGALTIQSTCVGTYSIKSELGQTIQSFELNNTNNYTVNVENLSNGIYFIVGFNNNKMTNQKVVIMK